MKKKVFLAFFSFLFTLSLLAQDSCSLRISLLTCAPGAELYSTFGHTAIRVTDSAAGIDEVYNYGAFEFAPDFYYKFVKGKLLYALAVEDFDSFVLQYQAESRSIVEQEVTFTCAQKERLYTALRTNALPENRNYRYDFLFDNCTTRAGDMLVGNSSGPVEFQPLFPASRPSFRDLIYVYLNKANQDWSKLGIDLLLGARLDRKAINEEAMFLPDNLMKAMDTATVNRQPLVKEEQTILAMPLVASESYLVTPFVLFTALLVVFGLLSFLKGDGAQRVLAVFDFLFFLVLGLTGILLLFMWFGTEHALCANNYNLLWALPTHVVAAFFLRQKRGRMRIYLRATCYLSLLLLLCWAFLPQHLNTNLLPLVVLLALRSGMLSTNRYAKQRTAV